MLAELNEKGGLSPMNPSLEDVEQNVLLTPVESNSGVEYVVSNPQDMSSEDFSKNLIIQEEELSDNSANARHNQKSYENLMAGDRPSLLPGPN